MADIPDHIIQSHLWLMKHTLEDYKLFIEVMEDHIDNLSRVVGVVGEDNSISEQTEITPQELMNQGGSWLKEVRVWVQNNAINGDDVHWGSDEVVRISPTMRQLEQAAAYIAAAAIEEYRNRG